MKQETPQATRVILVRHGQSSYNSQKRIQGRCDKSVLTEKGRDQASKIGAALSSLTFNAIYSSPLQRAKETAEIVRSSLDAPPELQTPDTLREVDLPLWEEMHKSEVKEKFPEEYRCWKEKPHEFRMLLAKPEGTIDHFPVLALYEQANSFWQDILPRHRGQTILIVAHNGINRCLLGTALGISPACYHSIQQSNCGVSVLNFGNFTQLESMNVISHMGEDFPSPREGHRGCRLLLVRHGETEWNREKRFQGVRDVPLNENGREQARRAAEFLKDVKIDFAVSSPMLRPKETAEIILQHHPDTPLQLEKEMMEISHGLWEGKLEAEIEQAFPSQLQQWQSSPETVQMPDGENLQQVWSRVKVAWDRIVESAAPQSTGIVVAHDAVNKAILCHLFGLEPDRFWTFKQGNCAVTVIDYPKGIEGVPVLQTMNITAHLSGGILDKTAAGAL